jgi:DNA-binding CsgD family transcriptional regulator
MDNPIHILNQLGILNSFAVAKKVTEKEMEKYFYKYKKTGKSTREIGEMLRKKILTDIQNAIVNNEIPGMISPQELIKLLGIKEKTIKRIPEINKLVILLSQKLEEKNYDRMSLCYFINYLVNILGLTEEDFEKFHNQKNDDDDDNDAFKDA